MRRYQYTHTGTEATTGYFSCEPVPLPGLEEGLRELAAHPLDDFLRRHLIKRMAPLDRRETDRAVAGAFPDVPLPAAISALREELALLAGEPDIASPDENESAIEASPLIFLRWRGLPDREPHRLWGEVFNANIQQHRALKRPGETGLPPLYKDRTPSLPGLSPAFAAPFPVRVEDLYPGHKERTGHLPAHERPPSAETAALAEERLAARGVIAGQEMRHTASLSPIALLRPWNIDMAVRQGRHEFSLRGRATTYGRGLSIADARASCLMEMVERASAYLDVSGDMVARRARPSKLVTGSRTALLRDDCQAIDPNDYPLEVPYTDQELVWMQGESPGGGTICVPVQMVGLFCNLDEISLYDSPGSTGIATGCGREEARVAALLEILERDAEATAPFSKAGCFRLEADESRDPLIASLLADYAARGINIQFQDITGPLGVPVYKCFVMSSRGAISRGHGAGLSARKAIISALTETPFPYPDGGPSGPLLRKLPARKLHELPDYGLPTPAASLALLEDLLVRNGRPPVYVDVTREDLQFPVVRALVPGMELAADRDTFSRVPLRLWENYVKFFAE